MCMNKLSLIKTLRTEVRLTKPEAAAVIKIFFDEFNKIDWLIQLVFFVGHRSYTTQNP